MGYSFQHMIVEVIPVMCYSFGVVIRCTNSFYFSHTQLTRPRVYHCQPFVFLNHISVFCHIVNQCEIVGNMTKY